MSFQTFGLFLSPPDTTLQINTAAGHIPCTFIHWTNSNKHIRNSELKARNVTGTLTGVCSSHLNSAAIIGNWKGQNELRPLLGSSASKKQINKQIPVNKKTII